MDHVLATLKKENPNRAFYRPDNAGCTDAAYTTLACKKVSKRTGVCVQRLDFQGGKNRAVYLLQQWKAMYVPLSTRATTSLQLHNCTLQRHMVKFLELECPCTRLVL